MTGTKIEVDRRAEAQQFVHDVTGRKMGSRRYKFRFPWRALDVIYDIYLICTRWKISRLMDQTGRKKIALLTLIVPGRELASEKLISHFTNSNHEVHVFSKCIEKYGKLENINILLKGVDLKSYDYIIVSDDDVTIPHGATDRMIAIAEAFELDIFQPAHRFVSYSSYTINQRSFGSIARQTNHVEVGPVTIFGSKVYSSVFPFPELKYGWGIEHSWSFEAKKKGWKLGVIDATPLSHYRPVGASYNWEAARQELIEYLSVHPYLSREEENKVLDRF